MSPNPRRVGKRHVTSRVGAVACCGGLLSRHRLGCPDQSSVTHHSSPEALGCNRRRLFGQDPRSVYSNPPPPQFGGRIWPILPNWSAELLGF